MPPISVLCIGEILFDNLADQIGKSFAEVTSWTAYPGGAPANVACALVKLGTTAGFVGCVGLDEGGSTLISLLTDLSVNCEGIQRHPTAPTRMVYVTRTESGDRIFAGFGRYDTAAFADTCLSADHLPRSLFQDAKFLVTGTLELAYPESGEALYRAVELAQAQSCKIVVDINWRPVFWNNTDLAQPLISNLLSHADFIKLTDEEAEWFFGSRKLEAIVAAYPQVQGVLMTAGEKGCHYWLQGNTGHIPAFPVEVVDTTGAGDAFLAGFLHRLSANPSVDLSEPLQAEQTVRFASAVGALTTLKSGAIAAQPTHQAVDAFLSTLR
jgi:fructokinase